MASARKSSKKTAAKGRKTSAKKTVKKASNGNGGTYNRIAPEARLTLVKNPFREGSVRHTAAALAGKAKTAAEYLKKGSGNYLSWLVRTGHVKISGAKAA